MAKYWNGEWPNANSISLAIDGSACDGLSTSGLGILYRLVWFLAWGSVNTYFSEIDPDPKIPLDDGMICRIARCSAKEWRDEKDYILPFFSKNDDGYRLINGEAIRLTRSRRRTTIPPTSKSAASSRSGHRCTYCGSMDGPFHYDHIFPVARGGANDPSNIAIACRPCNLSKGCKTLEEWVCGRMLGAGLSTA